MQVLLFYYVKDVCAFARGDVMFLGGSVLLYVCSIMEKTGFYETHPLSRLM